jgi:hypothetical protein
MRRDINFVDALRDVREPLEVDRAEPDAEHAGRHAR